MEVYRGFDHELNALREFFSHHRAYCYCYLFQNYSTLTFTTCQTKFHFVLQVKDKLFRVRSSGKEHGTVTWAMNVMKTSNAKKGPHKAMNAYTEYTDKELDGQIAALTMNYLNMKTFEGRYCTLYIELLAQLFVRYTESSRRTEMTKYFFRFYKCPWSPKFCSRYRELVTATGSL